MAFELTEAQKREIRETLGFLNIDEPTKDILKSIGFGLAIFGTILTLIFTLDDIVDRIRKEL